MANEKRVRPTDPRYKHGFGKVQCRVCLEHYNYDTITGQGLN